MTAVAHVPARSIPHVSPESVEEHTARVATLQRELRQRSTTIATLRRELTRAIEAPTVVATVIVDGMLSVTLSTGAVLQRRPRVFDTAEEFSYRFEWVALEPVPGTRAAIVGMAYTEENPAGHYVDAEMRIVAGMGVIA